MSLEEIVARTGARPRRGGYYMGRCPCHDDRTPSLLIALVHDRIHVHCFAGCHQGEVRAALGLPVKTGTNVRASYVYLGSDGKYLFQVDRLEPKRFITRSYLGGDKWSSRRPDIPPEELPLYMQPLVEEAIERGEPIYLCEGEKDADAFIARGVVATTNPHGADNFTVFMARLLRKASVLMIVRDLDEAGERRARRIKALIPNARVLIPAKGKDAYEHFAHGLGIEDFILERPMLIRSVSEVEEIEVRWILPGLIPLGFPILMVGAPGTGKSTFAMYLACRLTRGESLFGEVKGEGRKVLFVSGEDDLESVLRKRARLFDAHPENLHLAPATQMDETGVSELRSAIVTEGYCLVILDSLASILPSQVDINSQSSVRRFLSALFGGLDLRSLGASCLLISHPNKDRRELVQYRAMGSIDFLAFFRHVLFMGYVRGSPNERGIMVVKSNLDVRPGGTALTFSYEPGAGLSSVRIGKKPARDVFPDLKVIRSEEIPESEQGY